jgi:hypothetical protein
VPFSFLVVGLAEDLMEVTDGRCCHRMPVTYPWAVIVCEYCRV